MNRSSWRRTAVLALLGTVLGLVPALVPDAGPAAEAATPVTTPGDLLSMKYGIFVHYVPGLTVDRNGVVVGDIDALADAFDAQDFADDLERFGVEYVKFTAWHKGMFPLYPSRVMTDVRGPGSSSSRDLIGDMIDAVSAKGIAVLLYTHPRDGHDMSNEDQIATGWGADGAATSPEPNPATFDFAAWNEFVIASYTELLDRYADRIVGIYLDEGDADAQSYDVVDYPRLRALIREKNPELVVQHNYYGNLYSAEVADHEYWRWQEFSSNDGARWPAYENQSVSSVAASSWWTTRPSTQNVMTFSTDDMYRYSVLQASANRTGGGLNWAGGVYPGGGWEAGFEEALTALADRMEPVEESIKGSYPSSAWPTRTGTTTGQLTWGVATRNPDDTIHYLHVLKPPAGNTLTIPAPADGRRFARAELLADGTPVTVGQSASGLTVQLPAGRSWDAVDTVVELHSASLSTGTAVAASSSLETAAWGAGRAVDGIVTSETSSLGYSSTSSLTANHGETVTIDLGQPTTLNQLVVVPRTDGPNAGHGLPVDATFQTSADGTTWNTAATVTDRPFSTESISVDVPTVAARYVRVAATELRANPNDGNRFRLQFAEFAVRHADPKGTGVLITSEYNNRQLQGTGDAVPGVAGAQYAVGSPTARTNPEIRWTVADAGNGTVSLTNGHSGRRLEVSGLDHPGAAGGRTVVQSTNALSDAQRWRVEPVGDGRVRFVHVGTGLGLQMTEDRYSTLWDVRHVVALPVSPGADEQSWRLN